jgi:hypothetical protein
LALSRRSQSASSKHRQFDDAILDLTARELHPGNMFEADSMLVQIAQGLMSCVEIRRQPAGLSGRSDRHDECDSAVTAFLRLGRNPNPATHRGIPPTRNAGPGKSMGSLSGSRSRPLSRPTFNRRNTVNVGIAAAPPPIANKPVLFVKHQTISLDTLLAGLVSPVQHFRDVDCSELQPSLPFQQLQNFVSDAHWILLECSGHECAPPDRTRLAQQSSS